MDWLQTLINGIIVIIAAMVPIGFKIMMDRQAERDRIDDEQRKRFMLMEQAIVSLLRDKIIDKTKIGLKMGCASVQDRENVSRLYQAYHALGGNDVCSSLYEQYMGMGVE